MRLRIRKKDRTQEGQSTAPRGGQAEYYAYPPGGSQNAGADGLPGTAGYRGGPKNKPPGGFVFHPPGHDPPKRPKKPWE